MDLNRLTGFFRFEGLQRLRLDVNRVTLGDFCRFFDHLG